MSTLRSFLVAATLGMAIAITVATLAILSSPTRAAERPVYLTVISEESEALLDDPFIADHLHLIRSTVDNVLPRIARHRAEGLILDRSTIEAFGADRLNEVRAQGLLLVALDMDHTQLHKATRGDWPSPRTSQDGEGQPSVQFATSWRAVTPEHQLAGVDGSDQFTATLFVARLAGHAVLGRGHAMFESDRPTYLHSVSREVRGMFLHPELVLAVEFVPVERITLMHNAREHEAEGLVVDRETALNFSPSQYHLLFAQGLVIVGIDLTSEELRAVMDGNRPEAFVESLATPRDPGQSMQFSYMWRDREHPHPVTAGPTEATERLHLPRLAQLLYEVAPRATDRTPRTNSPTP